jgi:hypothetical protein
MMIAPPFDEVPHVYNDDLWYSFMGICIGTGCKATGIRAGAGLQVRCIDPPTGSFRDPSQEEPRAVSCESGFQDFPDVYRFYVAMKAPPTTAAPSTWTVWVDTIGGWFGTRKTFGQPVEVWAATTDPRILVKSDNQVISPGACVYIDSAPRMPNLTMQVIGGDGKQVTGQATWRLSVTFLQTINQVVERKASRYRLAAPTPCQPQE